MGCRALLVGGDWAEIAPFVAPEARGAKIGRRILTGLEAAANGLGVRVIRPGARQTEAVALCRRLGYRERAPFGGHRQDALATCLEKWIA